MTDSKLTEGAFQKVVIELAQRFDWKVMHPLPGVSPKGRWSTATQGNGRGFPDLTLVRERIMFVELKADGRYLSVWQKMWRDSLLAAGGEWHCWKPAQWFDGTVERILGAHLPVPPRPIEEDPAQYQRLLEACDGDAQQAGRVFRVLPKRETAPPE